MENFDFELIKSEILKKDLHNSTCNSILNTASNLKLNSEKKKLLYVLKLHVKIKFLYLV